MIESTKPIDVVCVFDPAIDTERSDLDAYAATRDMGHLKFREGMQPTIYVIKRLSGPVVHAITQNASSDRDAHSLCFMRGVIEVRNLWPANGGEFEAIWRPKWKRDPGSVPNECLQNDELDLFPVDEWYEIGSVVHARSFLRRGRPVFCRLPPTSLEALERMEQSYRLADAKSRVSPKRVTPKPAAPLNSSAESATGGGATATGSDAAAP